MRTAARVLATRLWIRHALLRSCADTYRQFVSLFGRYSSPNTGYGLDLRLLHDWERGRRYVSAGMVHRVESCVPGTKYVYAISKLLSLKKLSAPGARRTIPEFVATSTTGERVWCLGAMGNRSTRGNEPETYVWKDSMALAGRSDFVGFVAILTLLREAMATPLYDRMLERHATALYTMLPALLGLPWVRPDADLLVQCVEDLCHQFLFASVSLDIDWEGFRRNIDDPEPWNRSPPWILGAHDRIFGRNGERARKDRPVPLIEGTRPLIPYMHPTVASRAPPVPHKRARPLGPYALLENLLDGR